MKPPTGSFKQTFGKGPETGELLDHGLQRGTGTTDALLGVYTFGYLSESVGYFGQAMAQIALDARDGFRPGNSVNMNLGLRYLDAGRWTPQIQLNLHGEQRESGAFADVSNSGATLAYLSPGLGRLWSAGLQYRL